MRNVLYVKKRSKCRPNSRIKIINDERYKLPDGVI